MPEYLKHSTFFTNSVSPSMSFRNTPKQTLVLGLLSLTLKGRHTVSARTPMQSPERSLSSACIRISMDVLRCQRAQSFACTRQPLLAA